MHENTSLELGEAKDRNYMMTRGKRLCYLELIKLGTTLDKKTLVNKDFQAIK